MTPQEVWSGKPLDYSGSSIFGFRAYAHVNHGKIEIKGDEVHISRICIESESVSILMYRRRNNSKTCY